MAIAYAAVGTKVEGNDLTSAAIPYPSGISAGDLLLAVISHKDASVYSAGSNGFTSVIQGGSTTIAYDVFYKVATGSESGTATFTTTSGKAAVGHMYRFTGCDSASPIGAVGTAYTGTSASITCTAGITTTVDNAVVVQFAFIADDDGDPLSKSGWSACEYNETTQGTDSALGAYYLAYSTSGTDTGSQTITQDLSNAYATFMVELKPPQPISATLSQTLGNVTIATTATVDIQGTLTKTLDNVTLSGTSIVTVSGTLSQVIDAVTLLATGEVTYNDTNAAADIQLGNVTLNATGTVEVTGVLTQTLDNVTLVSATVVPIEAVLSKALEAIGISATATVDIAAQVSAQLEDTLLEATADAGVSVNKAVLNITLNDVSVSAYGTLDISGSLVVTLDDVQIVSTIFKWHYIDPDSGDTWTLAADTDDVWSDQVDTGDVWTPALDNDDVWTNTNLEITTWH